MTSALITPAVEAHDLRKDFTRRARVGRPVLAAAGGCRR